jgi:hypothetical protein
MGRPKKTVGAGTPAETPRRTVELPAIFGRMPSYRMNRQVRALKIASATHAGDKITLTFDDGYFPPLEVPSWLTAPIDGQHMFMIDESGEQHIVPASEFNQHFKLNT